ncbi:HK97 gp10 family phage protein, partial [Streptococcus suis]|nr:HK97 gp10 family phage protein [Streptococcus suis]
NSHLLRNGGRSKAQPHIKPVEEKVKENFEKRIKELGR